MSEQSKLDYIEQNGHKFIHVSTISTAAANEQFMRNVQLVQQQRQALVSLNRILSPEEKAAIATQLKNREENLNKNNAEMAKAYGFSLARDYVHQLVRTRVFLKLTEEEYAKAKGDSSIPSDHLLVKGDTKYRLISEIPTADANDQFRHNVQVMQALRNRVVALRDSVAKMPEGDAKAKAQEELKKQAESLEENNKQMVAKYGFSLARDYLMEVVESKLYTRVNEEEFLKASQKAAEAN
ncbi:MAG: hypothetical protein LUD39_03265 [Opitutae bacterium]|nr:hypothetical protein [Opitutae bacterium]MCD8298760.1 hypothetical protein [Opitutae bacterium]